MTNFALWRFFFFFCLFIESYLVDSEGRVLLKQDLMLPESFAFFNYQVPLIFLEENRGFFFKKKKLPPALKKVFFWNSRIYWNGQFTIVLAVREAGFDVFDRFKQESVPWGLECPWNGGFFLLNVLARGSCSQVRHFSMFWLIWGQGIKGCTGGVGFVPFCVLRGRKLAEQIHFYGTKRRRSESGGFWGVF